MNKVTLVIEVEDIDELKDITNYKDAKLALWEISQEIFRPARKHGYMDSRLNEMLENSRPIRENGEEFASGYEIISRLEDKFYQILNEHNISLD